MTDPPLLNWHDHQHWARTEAPCQHCHQPTRLRDDDGKPAHKVCAERAAADRAARTVNRYEQGLTE